MAWTKDRPKKEGYDKVHGGRKVLARDENGAPAVMLNLMPVGFTVPNLPWRHIHSTVREFAFFLTGQSVVVEYESIDQQNGQFISKKQGFFMDVVRAACRASSPGRRRRPERRSSPGEPAPARRWADPDYETETYDVDYAPGWKPNPNPVDVSDERAGEAVIIERPDLTVLDTRAMDWEPVEEWANVPGLQGARRKVLARDDGGPVHQAQLSAARRDAGAPAVPSLPPHCPRVRVRPRGRACRSGSTRAPTSSRASS